MPVIGKPGVFPDKLAYQTKIYMTGHLSHLYFVSSGHRYQGHDERATGCASKIANVYIAMYHGHLIYINAPCTFASVGLIERWHKV